LRKRGRRARCNAMFGDCPCSAMNEFKDAYHHDGDTDQAK
jgi:hypothetical protein